MSIYPTALQSETIIHRAEDEPAGAMVRAERTDAQLVGLILAGDETAANDVRLVLPETGVCSTDAAYSNAASEGCCGGPAPAGNDACCVDDAVAKESGAAGCGCGAAQAKPVAAKSCCGSEQNA